MEKSRHIMIESVCEVCGNVYLVRRIKAVAGQAHFCSKACFHEYERQAASLTRYGKSKGTKYLDSTKGIWMVHYYDDSGHIHVTTFARWWWELNVGNVPQGYKVSYKDGDRDNINPENFLLVTNRDVTLKAVQIKMNMPVSDESRNKMRESRHNFTGINRDTTYPNKFSKKLKSKIRERDADRCRICGANAVSVFGRVHHIDANKQHNDESNLLLVCVPCHGKIHSASKTNDPVILAFRSLLYT